MARKKKTHHTDEFKLRAVKLCLETDKNDSEIAKDLGLHPTTLSTWKQKYLKNQNQAFSKKKASTPEQEELKKLKKEMQIIKEERDILECQAKWIIIQQVEVLLKQRLATSLIRNSA